MAIVKNATGIVDTQLLIKDSDYDSFGSRCCATQSYGRSGLKSWRAPILLVAGPFYISPLAAATWLPRHGSTLALLQLCKLLQQVEPSERLLILWLCKTHTDRFSLLPPQLWASICTHVTMDFMRLDSKEAPRPTTNYLIVSSVFSCSLHKDILLGFHAESLTLSSNHSFFIVSRGKSILSPTVLYLLPSLIKC